MRINLGERCTCYNRRAFDGQCKHELRLDPTFKVNHWNQRWLQENEYNIKNPSIDIYENVKEQRMLQLYEGSSSTTQNTSTMKESTCVENNITTMTEVIDVDLPDEEFVENNLLIDDENAIVNYKDVLDVATELCRTVINDQKIAKSTYCLLHEWTKRIRIDKSTQLNFVSVNTDLASYKSNTDSNIPIAANVTPQNKNKRDNRFISSLEAQRTFGMLQIPKTKHKKKRDEFFISSQNSNKYGCFLCGQPGHGRWGCTVLKRFAKNTANILPKNNLRSREKVCLMLITNTAEDIEPIRDNDNRIIFHELPKKVLTMVIHKKWRKLQETIISPLHQNNICVECTLLGKKGVVIINYSKALFTVGCINLYVGRSANNLIVNNIE